MLLIFFTWPCRALARDLLTSNNNYQKGYEKGLKDAFEGLESRRYRNNRNLSQYDNGYIRGYRKGAKENKSQTGKFYPLVDSPSKTVGSDFNGDGIKDLIVGAHGNDDGGDVAGAAYIFFGAGSLSGTKDVSSPSGPDVTILGRATIDQLGRFAGVSSAGDVNGDGFDDVIVGAYANNGGGDKAGAAYIFFGSGSLSGTKNAGPQSDVTVLGKVANDQLGRSVSSAGDVNGDGFDDVIVGAHLNDDGGQNNAGAAYIFFGSGNLSGTKTAGIQADVTILGRIASDLLGYSVSSAGDVNGDGFDDVIVGAYGNDDGGNIAGAAYIFFGAGNLSGTKDVSGPSGPDVTILGRAASDQLGFSVSSAGDVNGDGFDDVIVGAYTNGDGGANAGAAYVLFGAASLSGTKNVGSQSDVTVLGRAANDQLGRSVSSSGDVNDDGFDDVIVGAYKNSDGGSNAGAAYIFFGAGNLSGTKDVSGPSGPDGTILGSAAEGRLGRSISSLGDVNDDGFADVIVGVSVNNDGGSNAGAAYVFFGTTTLSGTKNAGPQSDVTILGRTANDYLGRSVGGGKK